MKILLRTRRLLRFFGFIPFECRLSLIFNSIQNFLVFGIGAATIVSTFIYTFRTSTVLKFLDAFYIVNAVCAVIGAYVMLMWQKPKIMKLIDDLEETINTRAKISPLAEFIYFRASKSAEKFTITSIVIIVFSAVAYILQWASVSIWLIFSKDYSIDELPLLYPLA